MAERLNGSFRRTHAALACVCVGIAAISALGGQRAPAMYRGNPERTGVAPAARHASSALRGLKWTYATDGPVRSSPTVADGTLYVGSGDGRLYALDVDTGSRRWVFDAKAPIDSSPAVGTDGVYFTDRSGSIVALDRSTGRERWRVRTGADAPFEWGREGWDVYTSSPAIVGDVVVVGSGDGCVYAVDARTGKERWRSRTAGRIRSSPAVAEGAVYFGSADGSLYAVDLASGALRWRFDTEGRTLSWRTFGYDRKTIQSSPAVGDGAVYVGSRDGRLYAVDARTGDQKWRSAGTEAWVITSPALSGGLVLSGRSDDQYVSAVRASDGAEVWRAETRGRVFSSPLAAGDTLYVGSAGRVLYALDVATGKERWQYRAGGAIYSSPAVADGTVVFGCDDGLIYALETGQGAPPRRAVFWDQTLVPMTSIPDHLAIRWYFEFWGYEALDSKGLAAFLTDRLADAAPSVVVFAMDYVPAAVASKPFGSSLFRRYLDGGGKVVWLGGPPFLLKRDPATGSARFEWNAAVGEDEGLDFDTPRELIGVDHKGTVFDTHGLRVTPDGARWG